MESMETVEKAENGGNGGKVAASLAAFNGSFQFDFFCLHMSKIPLQLRVQGKKIFPLFWASQLFNFLIFLVTCFLCVCVSTSRGAASFSGKAVKLVEVLVSIVKCAQ